MEGISNGECIHTWEMQQAFSFLPDKVIGKQDDGWGDGGDICIFIMACKSI